MCSDRAHAATRDAPGRRTTETRARRCVMALEIMIVRHSAAGCRSRLGAPSPQRSSGLHGGQASSQIIHGEKEVRTSGALGGIAAASTARLETQHPLGSGGPTRRKPLAALLQTARLLLTASLRRKVQFAPAGGVRWSGETRQVGRAAKWRALCALARRGGALARTPKDFDGGGGCALPSVPTGMRRDPSTHGTSPSPAHPRPPLSFSDARGPMHGRAARCPARRSAMTKVVHPRTHVLGVYQRL